MPSTTPLASCCMKFDEFGDTLAKVITGYKVDGGKWVAVKTETLS